MIPAGEDGRWINELERFLILRGRIMNESRMYPGKVRAEIVGAYLAGTYRPVAQTIAFDS
jgi:hypothetical protein